jgi:Uma2 family endonuclease
MTKGIMTFDAARLDSTCTPAEYLQLERAAAYKSEYRNGQSVAMTGASRAHNLVAGNFFRELSTQLQGGACEAYVNDMRVKVSPTGLYTYPDVVVACPPIDFEDAEVDTLLNPVVIVEVLSPSTELYDRSEKFAHYRRLDSLKEYVLVAQDRLLVERYALEGGRWALTDYRMPDDVVPLDAIGCRVTLRAISGMVGLRCGSRQPARNDEPPTTR